MTTRLFPILALLALAACCENAAAQSARNVPYGATAASGPLTLDVYEPTAGGSGPHPLVIYVHGGGFVEGNKSQGRRYANALTTAGYVYASIDYRLADEAPFPAAPADVLTAVRYFRANAAQWNVDPERIALFGTSAGGGLVLFAGAAADTGRYEDDVWPDVSSRPNAVVSYFGPADFVTYPPMNGEATYVGSNTVEASPVTWIDPDDPPMLLVHGELDPVVEIGHSETMYAALQAAGVMSSLVRVANAGHGFVPTPPGAAVSPSMAEIDALTAAFLADVLVAEPSDTMPPTVDSVVVNEGKNKVRRGRTVPITWTASDDSEVVSVAISYSTDNGQTFPIAIVADVPGSASRFDWEVSENLPRSKTAVIRVEVRDAAGNVGWAASARFKVK